MNALKFENFVESDSAENAYHILNECYCSFVKHFMPNGQYLSCKLFNLLPVDERDTYHIAPACVIAGTISNVEQFFHSIGIQGRKLYRKKHKYLSFTHISIYITLLFYIYQNAEEFRNAILGKQYVSLEFYQNNFRELRGDSKKEKNMAVTYLKTYTNFFKHPKLIIHTHHTKFYIESKFGSEVKEECLSDDKFIKLFIDDKNRKDLEEYLNRNNVSILFRNLAKITTGIGKVIDELINFSIADKEVSKKILTNYTTMLPNNGG